ncbi:MAG: Gfo/Idh/MocA family oxidoreductase [Kiritimatiellia bacterium]
MSNQASRRDFLKLSTLAGYGAAAAMTPMAAHAQAAASGNTVMGLKTSKMERVRVGFIGLGARGKGHVATMLKIEGVDITAVCDTHQARLDSAVKAVIDAGRSKPAAFGDGPEAYKKMLERDDVDVVYISTPWELHTPQALDVMRAGKHACVEVPAAITLEDCWALVDTAEKTRRHCMMLENVAYGRTELMVLNMVRQGLLGELLHGEAAYIHDIRYQMNQVEHGTGSWRTLHYARRNGNLYPTHGLGPVAQYMGINHGDRFDYLSSISSPALGRPLHAKKRFPADHKWNQIKEWRCGDINTTIIKTIKGRSIMVQWDETSPRPATRLNLIQGTRGTFAGSPNRIALDYKKEELPAAIQKALGDKASTDCHKWDTNTAPLFEAYEHPLYKRMGEEAVRVGGHGGMDFLMNWRVIYCLINGEPLDQSVYDAAAWSSISPLSEASVAQRSQSVDVPDFTRGVWERTLPQAIVS